MDARINRVVAAFQEAGWKLDGSVEMTSEWWYEDILLLVSTWRPTGTLLYVTLLADPDIRDQKVAWAISFSSTLPRQNDLKSIATVTLNDIKKTDLAAFVKAISLTVRPG